MFVHAPLEHDASRSRSTSIAPMQAYVQGVWDAIVYHTDCAACADSGAELYCNLAANARVLKALDYCCWSRICGPLGRHAGSAPYQRRSTARWIVEAAYSPQPIRSQPQTLVSERMYACLIPTLTPSRERRTLDLRTSTGSCRLV